MKIFLFLVIVLCIFGTYSYGQTTYIPVNSDYQHLVERYEIKRGRFSEHLHTSVKPYTRKGIAALADSSLKLDNLSASDRFNLLYLLTDNWEWADSTDNESRKPIFKTFYKKKSDFYQVDTRDFNLHVNPVLYFSGGHATGDDKTPYINTRGVEVRGIISRKVGFYAYLADNQANFPYFIRQRITDTKALPNEGFWKTQEATGNIVSSGVDFLTARGYVTFNLVKNISFQFGHDKNAFGNGYRSLFLSDFSSNYLFMKLNTQVWKLNYNVIIAQLTADVLAANRVFPKKYASFHHLSLNVTDNFNIGLFESVVYARKDSAKNDTFEFAYLNPIMFYRAVEQGLGSADNSLLGLDFKWNIRKQLQLYGQVLLDEFVISEVRGGKGWWGNKQAAQLGLKYIDVAGIRNLDLQLEANLVRPYTYSHFDDAELSNYANYRQPLAHPLGANFNELIAIVRYQPLPRLNLAGKVFYSKLGEDEPGKNWGGNILLDNTTRVQDYDNKIGQGIGAKLMFADFTASYQLRHNLFIDVKHIFRRFDSNLDVRDNTTNFTSLSLRLNVGQRLYEF